MQACGCPGIGGGSTLMRGGTCTPHLADGCVPLVDAALLLQGVWITPSAFLCAVIIHVSTQHASIAGPPPSLPAMIGSRLFWGRPLLRWCLADHWHSHGIPICILTDGHCCSAEHHRPRLGPVYAPPPAGWR